MLSAVTITSKSSERKSSSENEVSTLAPANAAIKVKIITVEIIALGYLSTISDALDIILSTNTEPLTSVRLPSELESKIYLREV